MLLSAAVSPALPGEAFSVPPILILALFLLAWALRALVRASSTPRSSPAGEQERRGAPPGQRRRTKARQADYLARLAHSGRMITTTPTTQLAETLTAAAADLGFEVSCLLLLDEDSKTFVVCGARGIDGVVGSIVDASQGLFGVEPAARLARRVIVVDDYPSCPFADPDLATDIRSALAAPLSAGGKPIGVLTGAKRTSSGFTREEVEAFEVLALQGGLGLETVARRRVAFEAVSL